MLQLIIKMSMTMSLILMISLSVMAQDDWRIVAQGGDNINWSAPNFNDDDWQAVNIPSGLAKQNINIQSNMAWYRIHFNVPKNLHNQPLALSLGQIYDTYVVYFNGVEIAAMGQIPEYSHDYVYTGKYQAIAIPKKLINLNNKNVIAIRVFGAQGELGIMTGTLQVGHIHQMMTEVNNNNTPYLLVIILSFSIFLISGILMLGTGIVREQWLQHGYLAVFFISLALAYLCENMHFIAMDLKTPFIQRLAALFQISIPLSLLLYIKQRNSYVLSMLERLFMGLLLIWLLTFLMWNMPVKWLDEFNIIGLLLLTIITNMIFFNAIKSVKQQKPEAKTILLAISLATIAIILYTLGITHLFWGIDSMSLGLLLMVFILLQSVALRSGRERKLIGQYAIDVVNLQEKERSDLAKELHDNLGQRLAVMKMRLGMTNPQTTDIKQTINEIGESIGELRSIVSGLRPVILDKHSLGQAIVSIIKQFSSVGHINHTVDEHAQDPSEFVKLHLFRIFQECLQNAIKHSQADVIEVEYRILDDCYVLLVKDNGKGYETTVIKGLGLRSIQERTAQCGGRISIKTQLNRGTSVQVWIPCTTKNTKHHSHDEGEKQVMT